MHKALLLLGLMLIISGVILVITALAIKPLILGTQSAYVNESKVNVGGCIIVFFIPICFTGTSVMDSWLVIGFTIVTIAVLAFMIYLIYRVLKHLGI